MQIAYDIQESQLSVELTGEIDHHHAAGIRTEIDTKIYAHMPHTLILDFHNVTFMDSSGIGLIMGRYKILHPLGCEIILKNPQPHIERILRLANMERLARIQIHSPEEVAEL